MADFHQRHAADPEDAAEPDDEEVEAGLKELSERFGQTLTTDALASSLRLSWAQVYELDAETVYRKLRLEQARAAYQKRLHAIHREKVK